MEFEFYSEGPKGKIKKAIIYTPLNTEGTKYYNLAFGDLNDKTGKIDDLSVSNSGNMKLNLNKAFLGQMKIKVDPNMKDHSNDPYVVKKNEAAKRTIEKYGLSSELKRIQIEQFKK